MSININKLSQAFRASLVKSPLTGIQRSNAEREFSKNFKSGEDYMDAYIQSLSKFDLSMEEKAEIGEEFEALVQELSL